MNYKVFAQTSVKARFVRSGQNTMQHISKHSREYSKEGGVAGVRHCRFVRSLGCFNVLEQHHRKLLAGGGLS